MAFCIAPHIVGFIGSPFSLTYFLTNERSVSILVDPVAPAKFINIEKIDAGNKGFSIQFRNNQFPKPERLITWIGLEKNNNQLRPDHKLVIKQDLSNISKRAYHLKAKLLEIKELLD